MAKESKLSEQQWGSVRALWITTSRSIRDLAREFGVSEALIRRKAQDGNWGPRNAPERKRALVSAATAGVFANGAHVAQCATDPGFDPEKVIQGEADQDIRDMALATSVGRKILMRCDFIMDQTIEVVEEGKEPVSIPAVQDPKALKATAEAARAAMEMIRRSRGLDAPGADDLETLIEWGTVVGRR